MQNTAICIEDKDVAAVYNGAASATPARSQRHAPCSQPPETETPSATARGVDKPPCLSRLRETGRQGTWRDSASSTTPTCVSLPQPPHMAAAVLDWYGSGHSCGRLHNGVCFFWGTKKSPTALDAKRNTSYTRLGTWHVKMWCIQCTSVRSSEWHTLVDISCKFRAGEIV